MENMPIRMKMMKHGIKHWQVANAIGITAFTLSRWLQTELSEEHLTCITEAIDSLIEGKSHE